MDLLPYLRVNRERGLGPANLTADTGRSLSASPQTSMASCSQTEFVSSQGFSGSQVIPTGSRSPPEGERPASCGQPGQNENVVSSFAERFAPALNTSQHHNNIEDSRDEFSDSCGLNTTSIEVFETKHPSIPEAKIIPGSVPKSTGEWATKFQHHCDRYGVKPTFSYEEVSNQSFTAKLEVAGRTFLIKDPQPSKKLAKEEVCKLALAEMPPLDKMQGMDGAGERGKKRKNGDDVDEAPSKRDESENWIGILNIHFQRSKYPALRFEDGRSEKDPPRFSAGVTLPERPTTPFTSGPAMFSTKKAAQATAAKAAVLWLREQGKLRDTQNKTQKTSVDNGSEDISMMNESSRSAAQEVHELVAALGFLQPKWRSSPSADSSGQTVDGTGSSVDMAAWFNDRDAELEPRLKGPIGEVKSCCGKAQAKRACAERVLPVLLEIKQSRLGSMQQAFSA